VNLTHLTGFDLKIYLIIDLTAGVFDTSASQTKQKSKAKELTPEREA
jgi:hypothetical protein